jgi:hypothetical protein
VLSLSTQYNTAVLKQCKKHQKTGAAC